MLQAVIVTLIVTRHRSVPLFAAVGGTALVAGFLAAHWLPHRSVLSDSYVDRNPGWFSVVASIAGGAAMAVAGYRFLLSGRAATSGYEVEPIGEAVARAARPRSGHERGAPARHRVMRPS